MSCSPKWFENETATVTKEIDTHLPQYFSSKTAQQDYRNALTAGTRGVAETFKGQTGAAQIDFQVASDDFNGVLKALGLPPLS
jgi:plastocyanin domain-containing protein